MPNVYMIYMYIRYKKHLKDLKLKILRYTTYLRDTPHIQRYIRLHMLKNCFEPLSSYYFYDSPCKGMRLRIIMRFLPATAACKCTLKTIVYFYPLFFVVGNSRCVLKRKHFDDTSMTLFIVYCSFFSYVDALCHGLKNET